MYSVSALYNTIIAKDEHWFQTKVEINSVAYGEDSLMSVRAAYRVFGDEQPVVGGCLSAELEVKMLTPNALIPRMAEVKPYIRVTDGTDTSEWIPQGVFYIDTREESHNDNGLSTIKLHCYDAMLRSEADYPNTDHDWPEEGVPDWEVVDEIASTMGVSVDSRTYALMNKAYPIGLPAGYSMREVLGNIAAMYAGNWIMNFDGELRLVTLTELPDETNYLVDSLYDAITFGEPITEQTVSGNVVTFDGDGRSVQSLVADISASESGVSSVSVFRTGENLCGGDALNDEIQSHVSRTFNTTSRYVSIVSSVSGVLVDGLFKENTRYTFLFTIYKTSGIGSNIRVWYTDGTYDSIPAVSSAQTKQMRVLVTDSGKTVRDARVSNNSGTTRLYVDESGIFEGVLTADDFKVYNGNTYTVSLGTTLYDGGSLDVTTGKLISGGTTMQLDPTEVSTITGENNIWADSGNVTVKYLQGFGEVRILV